MIKKTTMIIKKLLNKVDVNPSTTLYDNNPTVRKYVNFCKQWEGGLSRNVNDSASSYPCPTPYNGVKGWHTNKGVTYRTWVSVYGTNKDNAFYEMKDSDWWNIFYENYFKKVKADQFPSLRIGLITTEYAWMSGVRQASLTLQRAINELGGNLVLDGKIGNLTINAMRGMDVELLMEKLFDKREQFYYSIAKGNNAKFLNGWLNRLNKLRILF